MRSWPPRRWKAAALGTVGFGLLLGLPTDLVPNPIFGRQIEAPWWAYPALAVTALLAGLLAATYVREGPQGTGETDESSPSEVTSFTATEKKATAGGLLAVFAVGCPTCNALVVLALGANGALAFFEPVQPFLAVGGIALLGLALRRRLATEQACALPASNAHAATAAGNDATGRDTDTTDGAGR